MSKRSSQSSFRRIIVLGLIAAGGFWYWTRWRPAQDYKQKAAHLESLVNDELTRSGITDKDVLQDLHRERSRWGIRWIETDRRIQTHLQKVVPLLDRLSRLAHAQGFAVLRRERSPSRVLLELGKGAFVLQRLEFVPLGGKDAAGIPVGKAFQVAVVIDDVAYDLAAMDHFAALGVPLTFAVLPRDKNSKALAEKADRLHFPVILHLPMEPLDLAHNNPGKAALYLNMNADDLRRQFEKNIASVPHIQGINNHMGSAFTEDPEKMALVMRWVKEKKLFFLDSHTSVRSVVARIAKEAGVPCLINETFLDNEDDPIAIERQLDLVLKLALKHNRTIAIGHYRRKHLVEALAHKIPEFQARGVSLVGLPALYPKSY